MKIPAMLRQARKAVAQDNFVEAEHLYALVLQDEAMQDMIDVKIRHAFCLEKTERTTEAIKVYQDVVRAYQAQEEANAAKTLTLKIATLEGFVRQGPKLTSDIDVEMEAAHRELDVMHEDDETIDFGDVDLFASSTHKIIPEVDACATLDLVPLEEDSCTVEDKHISTVELIVEHEKTVAEQESSKQKPNDTASVDVIQDMIKQGIHQNVVQKSGVEGVDIEFTDIGDFTPRLPEDAVPEKVSNPTVEKHLKHKAGKLFGK